MSGLNSPKARSPSGSGTASPPAGAPKAPKGLASGKRKKEKGSVSQLINQEVPFIPAKAKGAPGPGTCSPPAAKRNQQAIWHQSNTDFKPRQSGLIKKLAFAGRQVAANNALKPDDNPINLQVLGQASWRMGHRVGSVVSPVMSPVLRQPAPQKQISELQNFAQRVEEEVPTNRPAQESPLLADNGSVVIPLVPEYNANDQGLPRQKLPTKRSSM